VFLAVLALATAFTSVERYLVVVAEGVEEAHRVRTASDASDTGVGKFSRTVENLFASLLSDD